MLKDLDKFVITQKAILIRNKKCLILKNSMKSMQPNVWDLPGGRVVQREGLESSFKKQIKDETGLIDFKELALVEYDTFFFDFWPIPFLGIAKLIENDTDEIKISEEHTEAKWISMEEIEDYEYSWGKKMVDVIRKGFLEHKKAKEFERFIVLQKGVLIRDGKCLVLKKAANTINPGLWDLPGGRIDQDEKFKESFSREITEETGIKDFNILGVVDYTTAVSMLGPFCGILNLIESSEQQEVVLSMEHDEFRWVSQEELADLDFVWGGKLKTRIIKAFEMYKQIKSK